VLTLYLREQLAGNFLTTMMANVSPVASNLEETLSTLRYAASAKNIKTVVKKNEDPAQQRIRELTAEIEALKRELELSRHQVNVAQRLVRHIRGQPSSSSLLSSASMSSAGAASTGATASAEEEPGGTESTVSEPPVVVSSLSAHAKGALQQVWSFQEEPLIIAGDQIGGDVGKANLSRPFGTTI